MVTTQEGNGGLPFIYIVNQAAQAKICLLGATVLEYQPQDANPVLWTSPNSLYQVGTPIRGGIPVCWPWFGTHPTPGFPAHGFVRTQLWRMIHSEEVSPELTLVELGIEDDETSRRLWPHAFSLRLQVRVGAELSVTLASTNRSTAHFPFSAALHTYFQIADIDTIQVTGLENVPFLSKVHNFEQFVEADPIKITRQTDRVYLDTASTCVIHDPDWQRQIIVEKEGSQTSVVWNPWSKISSEVADLGPGAYRHYVCVETVVGPQEKLHLAPGATHELTTRFRLAPE